MTMFELDLVDAPSGESVLEWGAVGLGAGVVTGLVVLALIS